MDSRDVLFSLAIWEWISEVSAILAQSMNLPCRNLLSGTPTETPWSRPGSSHGAFLHIVCMEPCTYKPCAFLQTGLPVEYNGCKSAIDAVTYQASYPGKCNVHVYKRQCSV
jgi:hypothetical protein